MIRTSRLARAARALALPVAAALLASGAIIGVDTAVTTPAVHAAPTCPSHPPSTKERTHNGYRINPTPVHYDDSILTSRDMHENNFDAMTFKRVNDARRAQGVAPLKTTVELDDFADARAKEIQSDFSHRGFGGRIPGPVATSGENIYKYPRLHTYMGYPHLMAAEKDGYDWYYERPFLGYKGSDPHWKAILDERYTHVGISTYIDPRSGDVTNAMVFAR